MPDEPRKLLADCELAIGALREYIQALPEQMVAALPAMPGIDGDWLDVLQADLKAATASLAVHSLARERSGAVAASQRPA